MSETPPDQPGRPRAVSGRWVLLGMAVMAVLFVGGLMVVVPRIPRYNPQPESVLRQIERAQERYKSADPDEDGPDYGTLAELDRWQLVDPQVGQGTCAGYLYQAAPQGDGWRAVATPQPGKPGKRSYVIDQRGVVFYTTSGTLPLEGPLPEGLPQLPPPGQ